MPALVSVFIGDARTLRIPMKWEGRPFAPGDDYFLTFTAKLDEEDADAQARIQKISDVGLTVDDTDALVELVPWDTGSREADAEADPPVTAIEALAAGTILFCDIQAQAIADPTDIRTVAVFRLRAVRDITRTTETAVPIYTANPGLTYEDEFLTYT